jgi:hypothetical protein
MPKGFGKSGSGPDRDGPVFRKREYWSPDYIFRGQGQA